MAESGSKQSALRTALAGLIGNVLEWFDFAVYGYFASNIGHQFFPKSDPAVQTFLTYATFALGFFARPIGSLVLGRVGDRIGRRALLTLSIALMGGATLVLGLLPTYETIGIAAPILLMLMRVIQGFSLGGEFTGSMVYTTELASPMMRGLVSSSTAAGTTIGFILGSGTAWLVNHSMPAADVNAWGWRIPFVGSIVFLIVGYLLRRGIQETEEGLKAMQARPPLFPSLVADWRPIVQTFGIVAMTNAAYYLTFTYAVERRKAIAQAANDINADQFLLVNTLVLFAVLFAKPLGGWLSDKTGRRRLMMALTVGVMALIYSAMQFMVGGSLRNFAIGQVFMAIPLGMALGLQGAMVVEIFPLRTRVTSMSFAYSLTLALAGGTAPLVASWLVDKFHNPLAPVGYILAYGVLGLAIMWPMKETNARRLDQ
ncbi:MAG TPA: MFS transporter [Vicinamibacterales bacterium]|nr:MFS transporter [Vicinamibacterales bacterium]